MMDRSHRIPPILAVLYSDSHAADRAISELGYQLRSEGVAVAGIVQHNKVNPNREKCDMDVEELASGKVLRVSEDRGKEARGCRLDHEALSNAGALLSDALNNAPDLVIVNKFGKLEAEGKGLRDTIAEAVQLGIPTIVGVPYRNLEQWRLFTGGLAEECETTSPRLQQWLLQRGLRPDRKAPRLVRDATSGERQSKCQ